MQITQVEGQPFPPHIDYLPDNKACISACTAYLLFRLGASPDLWDPVEVDLMTGRLPNEPTPDIDATLLPLLEMGASLVQYHRFDREAFLLFGIDYLEQDYMSRHPERSMKHFHRHWTPGRVERHQKRTQAFLEQTKRYPSQWQQLLHEPDLELITSASAVPGQYVIANHRGISDNPLGYFHQFVAIGSSANEATGANPIVFTNSSYPPVRVQDRHSLAKRLETYRGATIVVAPEAK